MSQSFQFEIPGPVVAWKRARSNNGRRYTDPKMAAYQKLIRFAAAAVCPRDWPMAAEYQVTILYAPHDRRRRDIDNVAKVVCDALNGVAWDDDSMVSMLYVKRRMGACPGLFICVEWVAPVDSRVCQPKKTPSVTPSRSRRPKRPG